MGVTITKNIAQPQNAAGNYPWKGTIRDYLEPLQGKEHRQNHKTGPFKPLIRKEDLRPNTHKSYEVGPLLD